MTRARPGSRLPTALLTASLLAASLLLPGVAEADNAAAPTPALGHLEGIVFAAEGGAPLPGVWVEVLGVGGVTTDNDGAFHFPLPPGDYRLRLRLPGAEGQGEEGETIEGAGVAAGQVTELLLTVPSQGGAIGVILELPEGDLKAQTPVETGPPGILAGRILDEEGRPLKGARIFVRGQRAEAVTGADGSYRLSLPPGRFDLSLLLSGYATQSVVGVEIRPEETTDLSLTLLPAGMELQAFTITAPRIEGSTVALMEERRNTTAVSEVLGAEQMSRSGDTNAAAALQRVTGLTLVGGKYIYVRGLGERYSSATFNGALLPSPEPERRVVPLDLFGADVLESVLVQKTYSPDLPGEFGGGTIVLRTRQFPDAPLAKVGVSAGVVGNATFKDVQMAARGPMDWLGFGVGSRALPEAITEAYEARPGQALTEGARSDSYSEDDIAALGQSFENRWALESGTIPVDLMASASAGDSREAGFGKVGYLASLNYRNTWDHDTYTRRGFASSGDDLVEIRAFNFDEISNNVRLGTFLNLGARIGDRHTVSSTTNLSRNSELNTVVSEGSYTDEVYQRQFRTQWLEQQMLIEQLRGTHHLGVDKAWQLDWRLTGALASRAEPDRRDWTYERIAGDETEATGDDRYTVSSGAGANLIFYNTLSDRTGDIGGDLTRHLSLGGGDQEGSLKAGGVVMLRGRASHNNRYNFSFSPSDQDCIASVSSPQALGEEDASVVLDAANVGGCINFFEQTSGSDTYEARQNLAAVYALADLPAGDIFRVTAGARVERGTMITRTFNQFELNTAGASVESTPVDPVTRVLPALTLTASPWARSQLRFAYGRTLARPDFRELSEVYYQAVSGNFSVQGNKDLTLTTLDNFDLRWELYPSEGESLSVAAFYKRFIDPIEFVILAGAEPIIQPQNISAEGGGHGILDATAQNYGVELDVRHYLDWLAYGLKDTWVAGNLSLIRSQLDLSQASGSIETNTRRPLQGQSPYVANLQLGYDRPDSGTQFTLLYNVFGPRIAIVGTQGRPNIYEEPIHRVDATFRQRLPEGFSLSLKASNLLDWPARRSQGDTYTLERYDGRAASIGLSWSR